MESLLHTASLRPALIPFFEVLALAKAVLVLALDGLEVLKNCGLRPKKS